MVLLVFDERNSDSSNTNFGRVGFVVVVVAVVMDDGGGRRGVVGDVGEPFDALPLLLLLLLLL